MRATRTHLGVGTAAVGVAALLLSTLLPAASATPGSGGQSGAPPGYVKVPNSAYTPAPGEVDLGPAKPDAPVRFTLSMKIRNQGAADAMARSVSDPTSPHYGQYLTPSTYRARFAPTDADAATVTRWLRGAGLTIAYNPANHLTITATGDVAEADRAFYTDLHQYRSAPDSDGSTTTFLAPKTPLYVPRAVNAVVSGFLEGINKAARLARPMNRRSGTAPDVPGAHTTVSSVHTSATTAPARTAAPPPPAFVNAGPCSSFWAQRTDASAPAVPSSYVTPLPYAPCGYTPQQLQGAYGTSRLLRSGVNGRGVTVAITDAYNAPTILSDANTYARNRSQPEFAPGQFQEITPDYNRYGYDDTVNGDLCGEQGWYGEETLDVEAVHSMAPAANVLYVGGASCLDSDLLVALNTIIDSHRADIISNSWGDLGEDVDPVLLGTYHAEFVQAALEGIGVFFSSGDSGDEVDTIGSREPDYPAADPWVTAVGGTSLAVGAGDNYQFETGWGTAKSTLTDGAWQPTPPGNWLYGGGGGTSRVFKQPSYQRKVVPSSISQYFGGPRGRAVPDISTVGDPNTGFLVGETQEFPNGDAYGEYRIGGTSLSSPLMAGIEALADQAAGHPHGFANPAIYRQYGTGAYHDVTSPQRTLSVVRVDYVNGVDATDGTSTSLRTLNQTQSIRARRGYDDVTGVGSPTGPRYVLGLGRR